MAAAQQALMLRIAERYFDAALAAEALRVLRRQQDAVERALPRRATASSSATRRSPTRTRRRRGPQAVRAEVLAAETDLQLKQAALADADRLVRQRRCSRWRLPDGAVPQDLPALAAMAGRVPRRATCSCACRRPAPRSARQEAAKYSAVAAPSLDLVAQLAQDRLSGSGDFGSASNSLNNALIGVQLNVPLYTGGYRSARQDESLRLADKAVAEGERKAQQVALATRAAWLGLTVGASRVAALSEALAPHARAWTPRASAARSATARRWNC